MSPGVVPAAAIFAGGVIGGVVGALLAKHWWDFPPEDVERYGFVIVPLYAFIGAIVGLFGAAVLVAAAMVVMWVRRQRGFTRV